MRLYLGHLAILAGIIFLGCKPQENTFVPPPPPEVTFSLPVRQQVTDYLEYTGRTEAVSEVEIRARVQGFIDQIKYTDGQRVKTGDVLFIIDPRPFQAALDQAKGDLQGKEATYATALVQFQQMEDAFKRNAASHYEYLTKKAQRDAAEASVLVDKARVAEAQLNLEYTTARAPAGGKVNKASVEVGSLVNVGTLLTTLVNDERIYAYFEISESDLLAARKGRATTVPAATSASATESASAPANAPVIPVEMALVDQAGYPQKGTLDYIANKVNPSTGTISVRGVFDNPGYNIFSGMFVRLRIPLEEHSALLVPELALGSDQAGQYVLAVGPNNVVERVAVKTGAPVGTMRQITSGLQGQERIVVNGILRARPGAKVTPVSAPVAQGSAMK